MVPVVDLTAKSAKKKFFLWATQPSLGCFFAVAVCFCRRQEPLACSYSSSCAAAVIYVCRVSPRYVPVQQSLSFSVIATTVCLVSHNSDSS